MDLPGIADELYALAPEEFTAARNARAKQVAGDSGGKDLSDQVRRLQKPSAAAWVVNMLVRHRSDEVDEAIGLGEQLREAQENLDRKALAALNKQRRQLVSALARQAAELAEELGHRVSASVLTEVEHTLQAAMTDPEAATAIRTGRLVRSLATVGFEPVDLEGAVGVPGPGMRASSPPPARPRKTDDSAARELAEARRELEEAEREVRDTTATLEGIEERLAETTGRRDDLESELAELEDRIREVESGIADTDRQSRSLARERDRADRAAGAAAREADRARDRLERLG